MQAIQLLALGEQISLGLRLTCNRFAEAASNSDTPDLAEDAAVAARELQQCIDAVAAAGPAESDQLFSQVLSATERAAEVVEQCMALLGQEQATQMAIASHRWLGQQPAGAAPTSAAPTCRQRVGRRPAREWAACGAGESSTACSAMGWRALVGLHAARKPPAVALEMPQKAFSHHPHHLEPFSPPTLPDLAAAPAERCGTAAPPARTPTGFRAGTGACASCWARSGGSAKQLGVQQQRATASSSRGEMAFFCHQPALPI